MIGLLGGALRAGTDGEHRTTRHSRRAKCRIPLWVGIAPCLACVRRRRLRSDPGDLRQPTKLAFTQLIGPLAAVDTGVLSAISGVASDPSTESGGRTANAEICPGLFAEFMHGL